ncbi:Dynein light chain roadblock-type protein [Novymonas esmeraldas]|uniref:Dynein light chain roadblock n=1 Tax=Novymonas esmeraldas TaxID=1808958 RepID=A0AAW0ESP3_9TRYP
MAAAGSGPDIEELVKRITSHRGVRGFLILNNDGIAIRHSFTEASRELAVQYAALFQPLAMSAKTVLQDIDSNNELQLIRLRSRKDEIIVAPDSKYMLIIIQDAEVDKTEVKK